MSTVKEIVNIGGVSTNVYKCEGPLTSSIAVAFVIHGRTGSANDVDPVVRKLMNQANSSKELIRNLFVVTLVDPFLYFYNVYRFAYTQQDHRNHGGRVLDAKANNTWTENEPNERHA